MNSNHAVTSTVSSISQLQHARPFLKWAGGKTQLIPEILARFPKVFRKYHEPFMGGGAVFFALAPNRAILSDINADLVDTYRAIRDEPEAVISALQRHQVTEADYYRVRSQKRGELSLVAAAARTIYLNRTCYNGLYRVNLKGEFNVPFGRYANPTICNSENLYLASLALQNVKIRCEDALAIDKRVQRGDLVYFDPPYDPLSPTSSFTTYARGGFGNEQQAALADLFIKLANRGVHVVLSNSDTPFIRELYRDFRIDSVYARRAINSRADRRGHVREVIVSVA
ncbi:MAG: DNA adenine methylase [Deltaproteobacteria bacterium]|nr:DNA adenine methylase [Deltaproteobacteria bacterium]